MLPSAAVNALAALLLTTTLTTPAPTTTASAPPPAATTNAPAAPRVPSKFETKSRELVTNLTGGQLAAAGKDFNNAMRLRVPEKVLGELKQQFDEQLGAFRDVKEVKETYVKGLPVTELICDFEKHPVSVQVAWDAYGRIGAVYFNAIVPLAVEPQLEKIARELLENFNAGRYHVVGKDFTGPLRQQLSPARLQELSKQTASKYGKFRSVTEVRQKIEKYKIIDVISAYDNGPVDLRVVFDGHARVVGVRFSPYKPELELELGQQAPRTR